MSDSLSTTAWTAEFEQILCDALPALAERGELRPDVCLRDNGLDSMATIEMLLRIEETFEISIPDSLLNSRTFTDPGSLWAVVDRLRDR
jgi:acyl carrier protein